LLARFSEKALARRERDFPRIAFVSKVEVALIKLIRILIRILVGAVTIIIITE